MARATPTPQQVQCDWLGLANSSTEHSVVQGIPTGEGVGVKVQESMWQHVILYLNEMGVGLGLWPRNSDIAHFMMVATM